MGMPEKTQKGMNIAPDGTVYEVLDDGTIKRIGKVSSDGNFEPFGEQKNDFKVIDSVLYRIINGREEEIGRILPDGDIEPVLATWVCPKCGMKENNNEFCPECGFKRPERVSKTKRTYKTASLVLVLILLACGVLWNLYLTALVNQKASSAVSLNSFSKILQRMDALESWQRQEKKRVFGNLTWSERSKNNMDWNSAKKYCEDLKEGGYTDWRLPNIDELRTLIQNHSGTQTGGSCPISEKAGKLSNNDKNSDCHDRQGSNFSKLGDTNWFWSSSVRSDNSNDRWFVSFYLGAMDNRSVDYNNYVRCVRSEKTVSQKKEKETSKQSGAATRSTKTEKSTNAEPTTKASYKTKAVPATKKKESTPKKIEGTTKEGNTFSIEFN